MRPQHAGEPAEAAGDDEGEIFVQPGIVAQDLHAQLALANAHQAAAERGAHQRVHAQKRNREQAEDQVEERHLVCEVDAEFGTLPQIDAVVAAGQRVPAVGEPPHALSERERDHQKIDAGGADREQAEQGGKQSAAEHAERYDEPEIVAQAELVACRQDRGHVGADAEIGGLAERGEAGEAEQDVEAHHQDGERERAGGEQDEEGVRVRDGDRDRGQHRRHDKDLDPLDLHSFGRHAHSRPNSPVGFTARIRAIGA